MYHIWYLLQDEPAVLYIFQYTPRIDIIVPCWIYSLQNKNYCITVFCFTFKHNNFILCHIWYLLHDDLPFYIYSSTLPVLISTCCIEFNNYKTRITALQYSTTLSNLITSFCIIFDICYMMNLQFYIYSSILPGLISSCRVEFIHYKTRLLYYSILLHFQA